MKRSQIIVLVVALALVAGLYALPKVVVRKDAEQTAKAKQSAEPGADANGPHNAAPDSAKVKLAETHQQELSPEALQEISSLRSSFATAKGSAQAVAAQKLMQRYTRAGRYDSAASYAQKLAELQPSEANRVAAGDRFYEAAGFSMDEGKRNQFLQQAQAYYKQVAEQNPGNLEAKTKLGVTLVDGPEPMKGIQTLLEVVKQDPANELAIYHLGIRAIQSGQHQKALQRFKTLEELNPKNAQALFYAGVCYKHLGNREEARQYFLRVKELDKDPAVQASVNEQLAELK